MDITLNNPTGTGITHTDNFPTPSPFTIDTNTYIKLKATDTGAIGYGYGIYIDPATPNLYYELDPIQGAGARVEINNQGAISSVITTSQTLGTLSGSSVFLTNAATQRDMLLNQDFINFSSTTVPALTTALAADMLEEPTIPAPPPPAILPLMLPMLPPKIELIPPATPFAMRRSYRAPRVPFMAKRATAPTAIVAPMGPSMAIKFKTFASVSNT